MAHMELRRAAARRTVKVDQPTQVRFGNGAYVKERLSELRAGRYGMTDSGFAYTYRSIVASRRCLRQDVQAVIQHTMPGEPRKPLAIRATRITARIRWPEECGRERRSSVKWWAGVLDDKTRRQHHHKDRRLRMERRSCAFDPSNRYSAMYLWEPGGWYPKRFR